MINAYQIAALMLYRDKHATIPVEVSDRLGSIQTLIERAKPEGELVSTQVIGLIVDDYIRNHELER